MRLLFIGVFFIQCAFAAAGTVAIGNLAVAFQGKGYQSTPEKPLKGPMNDLWCQASDNGEHKEIANARFVRVHDRKHFEAHIDDDSKKAILIFGNVPVTEAAKYRCEITTSDGDHVFGNMFAYSHPVIHTNTSVGVYKPDDNQENELVAKQAIYTDLDASAQFDCPVVGYPHPNVVWYKDGLPIDAGLKYVMRHRGKQLTVKNITEADIGVYRCRAYNTFASIVDGAEMIMKSHWTSHYS
ncbi:unnamed protein product, partial [Mesorhabditis belari]|uniref:Ig-like domain-containing protein n=1 Tax=Mesorhabditis belari TaxID=2138241 RepID=A0AAF3FUP2_9BILA